MKHLRAPAIRALFACGLVLFAATGEAAASNAGAQLTALAREMTLTWAQRHPAQATELGLTQYDDRFETPSSAYRAQDLGLVRTWQARLAAIDATNAAKTLAERDDVILLRAQLLSMERDLTVYRRDEKDYSASARRVVNVLFTQFVRIPEEPGPARLRAWKNIIARLRAAPAYIVAGQTLATEPGRLFGIVGSKELAGAPDFLGESLTQAAKAQLPRATFAAFAGARDRLLATLAATRSFIDSHVAAWPENFAIGRPAYDAMLRDEQLLPFDARDVARMAEDELAHGWAEQIWLESVAKARATPLGPLTGGGLAPAGEALIPYYRERIAELRKFVTERDVVTVPAWLGEMRVVETPAFLQPVQPGAAMQSPRLFSPETTGFYFITPSKSFQEAAKRLDLYEDFDRDRILSTAAHEAIPGHFMQFSIARRHPDFVRRIAGSGVFAEGWAYYGEEMFVRLGLYGDDLDGRLDVAQWERVRGARAIVDTKLATGEWGYREAADFFARETGAQPSQADGAVAGIALEPGDVISYTVGRFQLENLLAEYRTRTGAAGSLHDFHDRLLSYGTVPFAIVRAELLADLNKPAAAVRAAANY